MDQRRVIQNGYARNCAHCDGHITHVSPTWGPKLNCIDLSRVCRSLVEVIMTIALLLLLLLLLLLSLSLQEHKLALLQ